MHYENHYWKLLLKVHLLKIFNRYRFSLTAEWKIFLVPLGVGFFFFEKIKNKALQNVFSHENALYQKGGAIIINSCIW